MPTAGKYRATLIILKTRVPESAAADEGTIDGSYVRFVRDYAQAFGREEGDFFSTFVRGLTPTAKANAALRAQVFAA